MREPVERVDVLDVGSDGLDERWRRLPGARRRALAAGLGAALLLAAGLAWQDRGERRAAEQEQAARAAVAHVEGRLLTARARGPGGTRELRLLATNTGPLPVRVEGGELALAGVGRVDVAVEGLELAGGGRGVLRVRAARPDCPATVPSPDPAGVRAGTGDGGGGHADGPGPVNRLVLDARTADGELRRVDVPLGGAVWSQVARALGCSTR